jgi:hypothetical protein
LALGAYQVALQDDSDALDAHLESVDTDLLGFAIEGSAMGLVVLDQREPRDPSRLDGVLQWPLEHRSPC